MHATSRVAHAAILAQMSVHVNKHTDAKKVLSFCKDVKISVGLLKKLLILKYERFVFVILRCNGLV